MSKQKTIAPEFMTVGEVAKKMGVTVRALQYYDREGLFSPSAVSEGGRRLYDDKDIVKLHQILALKSLGFSFDEIKNRLTSLDEPTAVAAALSEQSNAIQAQIRVLTQSAKDIEALKAEVLQMQTVDFKKYADIIVNLQMKNDAYWIIKYFDDQMLDHLHKRFDKQSGEAMLNTFGALRDKAVKYQSENVAPESEQGQALAADFWAMITDFTGGDMSLLPQLMKMQENAAANEEWKIKQEILTAFIEPALSAYLTKSGINPFEVQK